MNRLVWLDWLVIAAYFALVFAIAWLYTDMGTRERGNLLDGDGNGTDDAIDDLRALREALLGRGFREGIDLLVVEDEGARHHESYGARRFPVAARFLFPGPAAGR